MTLHEARAWMRSRGIQICGEEHLKPRPPIRVSVLNGFMRAPAHREPDFREVPRYDMHPLHKAQQDGFENDYT